MKKTFQLSAVAIAIATSSSVMADITVPDNVIVNGNTAVNGNFTVSGGASNILTSAPITTGADLTIPTVNPTFANTTQPFSQDRVDTQDQTRSVDTQIIDGNKFQLNTSEQSGQQTWTTPQTASADYDANGVIIPGSLTGPVLGATTDNGFVASSVDKIQDLTLGRDNAADDYRLSISKTENGITDETIVNASGISTGQISLAGQDLATTIADGDSTTLNAANMYTDNQVASEASTRAAADTQLQANIDAEASTRAAADTQLQVNIDAEASTRAAADTQLQANIDAEASMREAGDQAIRDEIATKVTTNALEVNGDSTFNGAVTVNNVKSTTTVDQAGTPATTPEFGADTDGDGRPDTLIQTKEQTDAVTVSSQSQSYNENNLTFSSKTEKGTQTTTDQYTADIIYDQNGVATYGPNVANGQAVTSDLETIAEDSIIVGKETADSETALTIRSKDANGESATVVTSKSVTTGNVSASTITLAGKDLATTIAEGDAATLASANNYTDATATTLRDEAAAEKVRVDQAIADGDAATLVSANNYTDATATTLRGEAAAETTRVNQAIADGDATTLASANGYTDATATTLRGEAAAETTRVNKAIADGNTATLASANSYTNARVNQLNSRVDDVEKTAYRGIAIALAAQQAIPSIQPGQIAVFGGVGHYEGETAGAVGLVGALNDRTSLSAALGFAGGNEVGGRVGVAYVFGGK